MWNKEHLGNIFRKVEKAKNDLREAEIKVKTGISKFAMEELKNAKSALNLILDYEDKFWRQRAKVKWLKEGDRNTKFFHAMAAVKRKSNKIFRIHNMNGDWVSDQSEIVVAV